MKINLRRAFQRIFLVLGTLAFAVLLGEFALRDLGVQSPQKRFAGRYSVHEIIPNVQLLYTPRPNASNPEHGVLNMINSGGFRENEYPIQKNPLKSRILFLGDSLVYGYELSMAITLPKQLDAASREKGHFTLWGSFVVAKYT